jgi:hypothetical protein
MVPARCLDYVPPDFCLSDTQSEGDDDYAKFIISKPEEWSWAIRKWTTPYLAHRDSIDRRVDDDMIRRAENRNRAD